MGDLAAFERMCEVVINGSRDPAAYENANQQTMALGETPDNIGLLQSVFEASTNSCAIHVAANCLNKLVTDFWTSFSDSNRVEIRDYLLTLLINKGALLEAHAVSAVVALVARITKNGWLDEVPAADGSAGAASGGSGTSSGGVKNIVDSIHVFVSNSIVNRVIGLQIANEIISEMNVKTKHRSLTYHRKIAVSFRDHSLFRLFELALTMCNQVATGSVDMTGLSADAQALFEDRIAEESLKLLINCLKFDFIGSNPDEDTEPAAIQVPASWHDKIVPGTPLRLLFNMYKGFTTGKINIIPDASLAPIAGLGAAVAAATGSRTTAVASRPTTGAFGGAYGGAPFAGLAAGIAKGAGATRDFFTSERRAAQALEGLALLIAVRRTLFSKDGGDAARRKYLSDIMRGTCEILRESAGFTSTTCFHAFTRLLGRIKASYQLSEMVTVEGYAEWVGYVAEFTRQACARPSFSKNSLAYVLALWSRLVSSVPYLQAEYASKGPGNRTPDLVFDKYLPEIVVAYVQGRLDALSGTDAGEAAEVYAQLEELDVIEDELEHLPSICRFNYKPTCDGLISLFDPLYLRYTEGVGYIERSTPGTAAYDNAATALKVLECQLAWLISIMGAVVGGGGASSTSAMGGAYYNMYTAALLSGTPASTASILAATAAGAGSSSTGAMGGPVSEELLDGDLTRRVLELMSNLDARLVAACGGAAPATVLEHPSVVAAQVDERLELAFLYFLYNFRRAYINEQGGLPLEMIGAASSKAAAAASKEAATGGSLLIAASSASGKKKGAMSDSSAASSGGSGGAAGAASGGSGTGSAFAVDSGMTTQEALIVARAALAEPMSLAEMYEAATGRQKVFIALLMRMGLGDHTVVVTMIINKLANNLRFRGDTESIIQRTLSTLNELIFSYSSGRLLLSLGVIAQLLTEHTEEHFPFLTPPQNTRYRTQFYSALARLIFMEDESERFEPFMAPVVSKLEALAGVSTTRSEEIMRAVIGVARDLRGIVSAAHNRPTYVQVFEALFPRHVATLVQLMDTWADTPAVAVPLLKLMTELVHNKGQRITFGASSANGILLFRAASEMVGNYCRKVESVPITGTSNDYAPRWKGVAAALTCLVKALEGGYVNFGVFALYGDPALNLALTSVFKIILPLPVDDIMKFPKLALAYSGFLHDMFRSHMDFLSGMDTGSFLTCVQTITTQLDSLQADISAQAAFAMDHFATYYVRNAKKDTEVMAALSTHLASQPALFEMLMKVVFELVVFGDIGNQWSLARPLLSLTLASETVRPGAFTDMKNEVVALQADCDKERMEEEFGRLMKDITRSLDGMNRDRFQNRITLFRLACKEFAKAS